MHELHISLTRVSAEKIKLHWPFGSNHDRMADIRLRLPDISWTKYIK